MTAVTGKRPELLMHVMLVAAWARGMRCSLKHAHVIVSHVAGGRVRPAQGCIFQECVTHPTQVKPDVTCTCVDGCQCQAACQQPKGGVVISSALCERTNEVAAEHKIGSRRAQGCVSQVQPFQHPVLLVLSASKRQCLTPTRRLHCMACHPIHPTKCTFQRAVRFCGAYACCDLLPDAALNALCWPLWLQALIQRRVLTGLQSHQVLQSC